MEEISPSRRSPGGSSRLIKCISIVQIFLDALGNIWFNKGRKINE